MVMHHMRDAAVAAGLLCLAAVGVDAQELRLKRVMLSTGGVGYFEHEADVEGDAELTLDVRLSQVDDILKSIVVFDHTGGVGTVRMPGREPLDQIFQDLPFGRDAISSPIALLNALRGAEVEVEGARGFDGRLIGAKPETVRLPDGAGTVTRHRVSVMTADGIRQLIFEDAESIGFKDKKLNAEVGRALTAIAAHRAKGRRSLKIAIRGQGRRKVRVAYVVAAPLWKASYRLVMAAGEAEDRARLRGWAVIENTSGHAWRDVELTLLSGNPVTFRQALYTAYYVDRPSVPVEVLGRILPPADTGVVVGPTTQLEQRRALPGREKARADFGRRAPAKEAVAQLVPRSATSGVGAQPREGGRPTRMAAPVRLATREEAATQVVFRVPGGITVETGHSLMVPIVDRAVPARQVSLFQPDTHARHPLATARLTNDSASGLPPGVLTLYRRSAPSGAVSYVGDARLDTLPIGENRLVSFAVDQKTRIDREIERKSTLAQAVVNRGTFRRTFTDRQVTIYRVKAPATERRRLIIEHPRRQGWALLEPKIDKVVLTDRHHRIGVDLEAGAERTVTVVMERPRRETLAVASLAARQIAALADSTTLSPPIRRAFARLARLRGNVERHSAEIRQRSDERKRIFEDQARIRGNLNRVPQGSDIHRRYLKKLNRQENRIEQIDGAIKLARDNEKKAEAALAAFVADLNI